MSRRSPLVGWIAGVVAAAIVALAPWPAAAQAVGRIDGVVTDEAGAAGQAASVVPGVTVEAVHEGTGQVRAAATGPDGYYSIVQLAPGRYTVAAGLAGYRSVVRAGVTVNVDATARVDLRLQPGAVEEAVTVTADAPLVETAHATLGIVIDQRKVEDLPLIGRNFTQLGTLIPGVLAPPDSLGGQEGDATPGGFGAGTTGFAVNGMRNQSNNFLLDGATNNDTFNTGFVLRPPPDAIQEFKILTHSYGAEYGRNAGSVVNVVTRAGSNVPTGAGWIFNRDDARQARNYFAPEDQPKPALTENQFGGSLGGPLLRNRLFAFGYYEGHRRTSGETTNLVVLTDAQRTGNFAGGSAIIDPLTGAPFPGDVIPADRLDPAALALVEDFVPRANAGANRYIASPDATDDRDQFGLRFDFQLSSNHSVIARYLRSQTQAVGASVTRPIDTLAETTLQDFMVSDTHIFSANAINVARFSINRIRSNPAITSGVTNAEYGIDVPNIWPQATGLANISVNGFFSLGDVAQPFVERGNQVWQFANDFTWLRGRHTMKFGVDIRRERMVIAQINRPNGDYSFTGVHSGDAAADFLLGLPAQFRRTTSVTPLDGHGWLHSAYAQDELRLRSNLTLTYGVRYELPIPFAHVDDALATFRPGQQSERFPDAPTGLVYPGDPGIPRGTYETDTNNIAPRLGVVWDPTGNGRSSLRAAWGIFYDALAGQGDFYQAGVLAPPFAPLLQINEPAEMTLRDPLSGVAAGPAAFPPGLTFIGWGADFSTPWAQHFNVTWQQQIGAHLGAEIGYVGSRGQNQPLFMEINPGVYEPGQTTPGARLMPAFALMRPTFSVGQSWYDSLQASLRMRPARGMHFLASYTLGNARDHTSGLNIGPDAGPRRVPVTIGDDASIQRALDLEKGPAAFDVRHRLVLSGGAELPAPTGMGQAGEYLLGGWQLNGIVQWQSGSPLTATDSVTTIRRMRNLPQQVCDPNANAPHAVDAWFDTSCFVRRAQPDTAEPADTPRGSIRAPGFTRTDLSLFKNIPLAGTHRLQLRVEAFNVFNQVRWGSPGTSIGTANFGRITSASDGRIVQLAVKYSF